MILFGNRVFVNVIKSRIHMKPHIIRVAPKSNENVLVRDRKGYMEGRKPEKDTWRNRGKSHVNPHMMTKAKVESKIRNTLNHHQLKKKRKDSL